jgi:hypothetical protein
MIHLRAIKVPSIFRGVEKDKDAWLLMREKSSLCWRQDVELTDDPHQVTCKLVEGVEAGQQGDHAGC